ncbi:MAG: DUF6279 family lipoprotein [Burkholderiaceae bacterium]
MSLISLSVIVSIVAGCSAARLAYSNGETLSYWWLNGYVDFNSAQRPWVKREIAALFAWHRKTQLRSYVQFLKHAQKRVQGPVSEADLLVDYEDAQKCLLSIADHALPQLADLALSLNDEQIAHIEKKFASNNDEYRKDYLRGDVEDRQEFRFKKLRKQIEHWFGNFNHEQEKALRIASDNRPLNNELVMASRLQRQQALLVMLKKIHAEKPSRETTMRMIRDYIHAAMDRFGNQEHKKFFEATKLETVRIVANIVNTTEPDQKKHFQHATQQWINDFEALAL